MNIELGNDWDRWLTEQCKLPYYRQLMIFLEQEYQEFTIYPAKENIYNALKLTPYSKVKVVILGQDPYHGLGQAHGLSFSVQKGVKLPPSLRNIYKELQTDLEIPTPEHGCLEGWAKQGVLLLNTVLTVREGKPQSHQNKGWEELTDSVIRYLNQRAEPIVFILWGKPAQKKKALITSTRHRIIESAHPSPLSASRGFFGSRPFSKTNQYLKEIGHEEINWDCFNLST